MVQRTILGTGTMYHRNPPRRIRSRTFGLEAPVSDLLMLSRALRATSAQFRTCPDLRIAAYHSSRLIGSSFVQHRDTEDNNADTPFDFTPENYERVHAILNRYPKNYKTSAIIPLLDLAQRQHGGWLPLAAMNKVARIVDAKPIQVYEVATFYTMFNREKVGKYFIQLCGTTPCMICGSEEIKQIIEDHLGIKEGDSTDDGMFTLREVECLGACANAPMVQINDDYYENLTPKTTRELLDACKNGMPPPMNKWGSLPMNGQLSCEGPQGKSTLKWDKAPGPGFRMRPDDELIPKVNPEDIKNAMLY